MNVKNAIVVYMSPDSITMRITWCSLLWPPWEALYANRVFSRSTRQIRNTNSPKSKNKSGTVSAASMWLTDQL
jgi:hypothetical protein